jgi:hypothetical protein
MAPKEKAIQLVEVYWKSEHQPFNYEHAKQCALIAVDEIIDSSPSFPNNTDWDYCGGTHQYYYEAQREEAEKYWQEVKQEIEKL